MDETPRPTAAELGISEAEYERILRGVAARQGGPSAVPLPAARQAEAPARPARWRTRYRYGVIGLAAVAALLRWQAGNDDRDPAYAFQSTAGGHPVTYSACEPVKVAIYPAGGPADAEMLVRDAVATLRSASGLDLVVVGAFGGHAPNWNFEASDAVRITDPISVSWQDGDAIAELTDHVAGLGGSRSIMRGNVRRLVAGTVALSSDYFAQVDDREATAVILHELGHVLGLAHVDSPDEIMYPSRDSGQMELGPGDLEGLAKLGQVPCT